MNTPRRHRGRLAASIVFLIAATLCGGLALLGIGIETEGVAFALGLAMAVVPVPFYVALVTTIDQFEPEPRWLLVMAFLWGASIAALFAMLFNGINEELLTTFAGATYGGVLTGILSAPFVEELAKGAVLLMLFWWRRDEFDNVTDGIIYASMVGLGFAMTENVQYYSQSAMSGVAGGPGPVFFLRGVLAPFSHPLFTAMFGIGLGVARETGRKSVRFFAPLLGLAAAMLLHSLWNLGASLGAWFFAGYLLIMMPAFLAVIIIAVASLRREAFIIRKYLDGAVTVGVLSAEDVAIASSVRRRIGASFRAFFRGGIRKWSARRRMNALTAELAFHYWRSTRFGNPHAAEIHGELLASLQAARREALPV